MDETGLSSLSVCAECGNPTGKGVPLVLNGSSLEAADDWPWHAIVFWRKGSRMESICGGTLITSKLVVSGTHPAHLVVIGQAIPKPVKGGWGTT